jgi:hypothetical protein
VKRIAPLLLLILQFSQLQAETVFVHTGNTNPLTEGWTTEGFAQDTTFGPITNDGGFDAWYVSDNSFELGSHFQYLQTLTDGQVTRANTNGWTLTAKMRVDVNNPPGLSPFMEYTDGILRFVLGFGRGDGDDFKLILWDGGCTSRLCFRVTGEVYTFEDAGDSYHEYQLVYDPSAGSADLYIDGIERASNYEGGVHPPSGVGRVGWGSLHDTGGGAGRYNFVHFEIVPEPSSVVPVVVILLSLFVFWRRVRLG